MHTEAAQIYAAQARRSGQKNQAAVSRPQLVLPEKKKGKTGRVRGCARANSAGRVMEEWNSIPLISRGKGLTVLFSGPQHGKNYGD